MEGIIFNINRYAVHDGPGIRVAFYMKGCPLSCWWCHNPEGINPEREWLNRIDRIGDKEFEVKEEVGKRYSVDDIVQIVEKDRIFLEESGGGVTFSGGEPLLQDKFVFSALKKLKKSGFHTCIDTSGFGQIDAIKSLIPFTDLFLLDIKHSNFALHKKYTGVSPEIILENYSLILNSNCDIFFRIPIIPAHNDDETNLSAIRQFIVDNMNANIKQIDLLPYHKIGSSKYLRFCIENKMKEVDEPNTVKMSELKAFFEKTEIKTKIGG